jgi:hypothetical protein
MAIITPARQKDTKTRGCPHHKIYHNPQEVWQSPPLVVILYPKLLTVGGPPYLNLENSNPNH